MSHGISGPGPGPGHRDLKIILVLEKDWLADVSSPYSGVADQGRHRCKRFIAIVIDGCRADRLLEADTPFMDRMRREGVDYVNTATVYPARTVHVFPGVRRVLRAGYLFG